MRCCVRNPKGRLRREKQKVSAVVTESMQFSYFLDSAFFNFIHLFDSFPQKQKCRRNPRVRVRKWLRQASFSFHFLIHHPHHLQKLFLRKYPFLHKQPGEGFLLDHLRHEEFFKGNGVFRVKGDCHENLLLCVTNHSRIAFISFKTSNACSRSLNVIAVPEAPALYLSGLHETFIKASAPTFCAS